MKKNIYKIVGVILFIFIGNYFLKSIVNINFSPKNPSGKLVYSYKENEFSDIKKVNYIDNELYITQKVFDVTKNMNIKDELILNDENKNRIQTESDLSSIKNYIENATEDNKKEVEQWYNRSSSYCEEYLCCGFEDEYGNNLYEFLQAILYS